MEDTYGREAGKKYHEQGVPAREEKIDIKLISRLLPQKLSVRLRAMLKALIVVIGLVWASLLLISWGGATEPQTQNQQIASTATRS
ncbi:MAG: hypothetical protein C0619_11940 [Desulfuromonas sp.]|nr:MAG: hypothetical protein C0619_11940 [Desulfuromonas sp.]